MITAATIIIHKERALIPTLALTEAGFGLLVEPVHTVDFSVSDIVSVLKNLMVGGTKVVPTPSRGQLGEKRSPVLRAAGVRSWKQLAREGLCYGIEWDSNGIRVVPSRKDRQGRWVDDRNRAIEFPPLVSLDTVVEALLVDARGRLGLER